MAASKSGQPTPGQLRRALVAVVLAEQRAVDHALQKRQDAQHVVQALLHGLHVHRRAAVEQQRLDGLAGVLEDAVEKLQVRPEALQVFVFRVNAERAVEHLLDFGEELLVGHFREEVHDRDDHARVEHDGRPGQAT